MTRLNAVLAATLVMFVAACATQPPPPKDILLPFTGKWGGTLEYRDYRSDKRVTLPTDLTVRRVSPSQLEFSYTYDDGPGKTVRSTAEVEIDRDSRTWRSIEGVNVLQYSVRGLADFGAPDGGTLVLEGEGKENNEMVTVRLTITASPATLVVLKETRRPGGEFAFRNQYTLNRR